LAPERYSGKTLAACLGRNFALYDELTEMQPTPFGTTQHFTYAATAMV
jgi:hypothetical protein